MNQYQIRKGKNMSKWIKRFKPEYLLILLVVIGGLAAWWLKTATPYGLGLRNDSVQYIFGARNLQAGNGYMRTSGGGELKPITTVPPMFSTAIAAVGLSGMEAIRSARFLVIALIGLDTILLGYLVYRLTGSVMFSLAGAVLFGFSSVTQEYFAWLMSEPLFVFTWLVCFILYDIFVRSKRRIWLILLGLFCGLAYLTRYIGMTLPITFGLMLLLFEPGWKSRLISICCLVLPFLPFVAGWAIRNTLLIGNPANRTLISHIVTPEKIQFGINNFWDWLLPNSLAGFLEENQSGLYILFLILFSLFLVGICFTLVRAWRRSTAPTQATGSFLGILAVALYCLVYPAMTLFSMSFVDASTVLDHRLLIPFYLAVLILLMAGLAWLFTRKVIAWKIITILVILACVILTALEGRQKVSELSQNGLGFNSVGVRESPTIRYIRQMPPGIIYTNKAFMVYILTDRLAYMMTGPTDPVTMTLREFNSDELDKMHQAVKEETAYLVYFKDAGYATDPWYLALMEGLRPIEEYSDGIIFKGAQ
jgi:4-amino-4-deoxy-L-arabinose transferase-like glycosyltransferase